MVTTKQTRVEVELTRKMTFTSKIFLVISLLSVFAAALSIFFIPNYGPWAYGFMGITLLFFVLWITTAFPHVKSYVGRRSTKLGVNAIVLVIVTIAILVGLNYVAVQNEVEKDLTSTGIYSLSDQTLKILENLTQEVKVTTFLTAEMSPVITEALDRYRVRNKRLKVEHVDTYAKPEVVRSYNVRRQNVIVLESMTRESRIENLNVDKLEEQLTNALIQVSREGTKNICFLTGHGELELDSMDSKGLSSYRDSLKGNRYVGKTFSLLEVEQVPSDCAALLVSGPEKALFEAEANALATFINKGGKVALFLDPYIDASWAKFVRRWGVKTNDMVVVEYNPIAQAFGGSPVVPTIGDFDPSVPFVADFKGQMALNLSRPVLAADKVPDSLTVTSIARTTQNSWGESVDLRKVRNLNFDRGKDMPGPVSVAVHVTGKSVENKDVDLVVFGDSDFLNNDFSRYVNNFDMSLNLVAYFVRDEDLVSIRPKDRKSDPLNLSSQNMRVMFGLSIILFPFLFFFAAGTVYLRRRSR